MPTFWPWTPVSARARPASAWPRCGERIVVAQETGVRDKEARESAWHSLLPFLILFPVLLLVVGDLVRKMFRPIATLSADIDQRDEQALHPKPVCATRRPAKAPGTACCRF
ncbi:hypothetical protein [Pseudomonas fluorescens]|uniref:hypothetical protein n=1 Tax=Pseudomonas TaxID=286 RepID=UPI00146D03AE|nr:hypothetical protein [Pseudomonas fluorescens]